MSRLGMPCGASSTTCCHDHSQVRRKAEGNRRIRARHHHAPGRGNRTKEAVTVRKTIPQLEPEVVRAEADKLRHGDDQKCATTSIKELRVRDVRITSRYQKADKLGSRSPRIFSFDLRFELRLAANAHTREAS